METLKVWWIRREMCEGEEREWVPTEKRKGGVCGRMISPFAPL